MNDITKEQIQKLEKIGIAIADSISADCYRICFTKITLSEMNLMYSMNVVARQKKKKKSGQTIFVN